MWEHNWEGGRGLKHLMQKKLKKRKTKSKHIQNQQYSSNTPMSHDKILDEAVAPECL